MSGTKAAAAPARRKSKLKKGHRGATKSVLETVLSAAAATAATAKAGTKKTSAAHASDEAGPSSKRAVRNSPRLLSQLTVGSRIAVHWPKDDTYYPAVVGAHAHQKGPHVYTIHYDDGDSETVDVASERIRLLGDTATRIIGALKTELEDAIEHASDATPPQILALLDELGGALIAESVTFRVLHHTGIGKALNKLRKHEDSHISKAALPIVGEWKRIVKETPPEVQEAVTNATAATTEEGVDKGGEDTATTTKATRTAPRTPVTPPAARGADTIDLTDSPSPVAPKKGRKKAKAKAKKPSKKQQAQTATLAAAAAKVTPGAVRSGEREEERDSGRASQMPSPPDLTSTLPIGKKGAEVAAVAASSTQNKRKGDVAVVAGAVASSAAAAAAAAEPNKAAPKQAAKRAAGSAKPTAATATATATTPKPPLPKEKKRSFHDQLLYTMLTSCKPYTLKSLAKETGTTAETLRHAMLSLLDKKLVLSKEFPGKQGSAREPKKLYWANPLTLEEIEEGGRGGGGKGKKGVGGAVVRELSKLLSASEEIEEARQSRQTLERRHRELTNELTPLLAIPTMTELDEQIAAAEQRLAAALSETQAVKERMANAANDHATNPTPSMSGGYASAACYPANRFQKKPPSQPRDPPTLKRHINHMLAEYRTRKRKCTDFVDELAEAMEKKTKDVTGDRVLGLDTDETEWGWYEDGATGKVWGTRPKRQKTGPLRSRGRDARQGAAATVEEEARPTVKIPAKYTGV